MNTQPQHMENMNNTANVMRVVTGEMVKGLHGLEDQAALMVDSFFAGQHLLFEGVPGVGKTALAENLSMAISSDSGRSYGRIQGVQDRQPADLLGSEIFNRKTDEFEIRRGPIFSSILVADEINRLPTKTQAALNEALNDRKVTIADQRLELPKPFFVVGTQNPYIQGEGNNRMSSALIDRFGASYYYGSPDQADRLNVGRSVVSGAAKQEPQKVVKLENMPAYMSVVESVHVNDTAIAMAATILTSLTEVRGVDMKADGYRSIIAAIRISQARALRLGVLVVTDDVLASVLPSVMRHRFEVDSEDPEAEKQAVIARAFGQRL